MELAADHDLADLHYPVIESRVEYRYFLLQIIKASDYTVSVAFLRRIKSAFPDSFLRTLVKSCSGIFHCLCPGRVVDHYLILHFMIQAGIDHIDLLTAGGTCCPEQFPALNLFPQDRIQVRVDPDPDLKIMQRAAFRAFDPLDLFL